ncbi:MULTISPECIES: Fic family protein [Serratia]|uniref:Fic family protein n=1 Tax=Serratia TaxID=613 RepID=UPI001020FC62|nr:MULTISPECIES: Fic family protein [Serratia]MBH2521633.1 Fic family protein [Serratia marcescens]RZA48591.1 Fic family protein [Serratia marcescens]UUW19881.1 Fic family protein [Serratia ureilytica]
MAKTKVEKAPDFDITKLDYQKIAPYFNKYEATDERGRYLHWNLLKWRVPRAEALDIWQAIKFKREVLMKFIPLTDINGKLFKYCTPHSMEARLHQIVKLAGASMGSIAGGKASDTLQKKFLVSSLIMEEAITSAQLEGASTTREVAKKMLEDEREPVDEDERMILNNFLLLKQAEKVCKEPLTIDLILDFHRIATSGTSENDVVPGEFRQDNSIYVDDGDGGIAHQPPDFELIQDRMQKLCDFANRDHSGTNGCEFIPPVIKAIILHFMMGYEHPFRDGNGRTARALFYWCMLKHEYNLFKYVSISKFIKDSPRDYGLSYLYTERDQNDLTYFIDFQLDVILKSFDELQNYLQEKTSDFYEVLSLLDNTRFNQELNFIQKDLIKKGTKEPGRVFTVKEVANSYSITENTARSHLNKLVDLKVFIPARDGRKTFYIVPSDLKKRLHAG